MRYIRIPFSRLALNYSRNGLSKDLFAQLLLCLPKDASIVGFGNDGSIATDYIFVQSSLFLDVPSGGIPPDCQGIFKTDNNGVEYCLTVDIGHAVDPVASAALNAPPIATIPANTIGGKIIVTFPHTYLSTFKDPGCAHFWKTYTGLSDSFEYCTTCNEKKS